MGVIWSTSIVLLTSATDKRMTVMVANPDVVASY